MKFNDIRLKESQRQQPLQISVICAHCTCANHMAITKDSVREDYVWRCYWCGKVNEPTEDDDTMQNDPSPVNVNSEVT